MCIAWRRSIGLLQLTSSLLTADKLRFWFVRWLYGLTCVCWQAGVTASQMVAITCIMPQFCTWPMRPSQTMLARTDQAATLVGALGEMTNSNGTCMPTLHEDVRVFNTAQITPCTTSLCRLLQVTKLHVHSRNNPKRDAHQRAWPDGSGQSLQSIFSSEQKCQYFNKQGKPQQQRHMQTSVNTATVWNFIWYLAIQDELSVSGYWRQLSLDFWIPVQFVDLLGHDSPVFRAQWLVRAVWLCWLCRFGTFDAVPCWLAFKQVLGDSPVKVLVARRCCHRRNPRMLQGLLRCHPLIHVQNQ